MVSVTVARGNVQKLFATPVITDELRGADKLNDELEKVILARQAEDPGHKLSNRGGWQSEHDLPLWGGAAAKKLIEHALLLGDAHTVGPKTDRSRWRCEAWANVSGSGDFNMPHIHSGTFWSAVYYVRVGDGEGGQLVLHDPRMPGLQMHAPHLSFRGLGPEVVAKIEPKPGLMVLFPAWLTHSVEPWTGAGNRISVAMNIRARTMLHPSHQENG
jgi:uncharacterized protein (TIGR02466 family)